MNVDSSIRATCAAQHGAISRAQLRAMNLTREQIARRLNNGTLIGAGARTFLLNGSPDNAGRRAITAVLESGPGAILSHTSAAAWWGLGAFTLEPLHTAIERNCHLKATDGVRLHHATIIPEGHRTSLDGIPIASPGLTLFMLAGMLPPDRLERAVDSAWSLRLVDGRGLRALLDRLARRGRNGVVAMREILEARGESWSPPQSNIESRFRQLMANNGLGRFRGQAKISDGHWTGRVDFYDDELDLVIEVQSERYHAALSDRRTDQERRQRIENLGMTLIEVWDSDLFHRPESVVERVEEAVRRLTLRSRYGNVVDSDPLAS